MRSRGRLIWIWLITLVLPLQSLAATAAVICMALHEPPAAMAPSASVDCIEHGAAAGEHDSACGACACCGMHCTALTSAPGLFAPVVPGEAAPGATQPLPPAAPPDRLERPPRG
jgi:hypothetical protein